MVLLTKRIVSVMVIVQQKSMLLCIVLKWSIFYVSSKDCSLPFQWSSINELDKLSSLQSLQCHNNPFMDTEKNPETLRQLIIAKISQLEVLNKSQVRDTSTNCMSLEKNIKSLPEESFSFSFKTTVCLGAGKVKWWLFHHLANGACCKATRSSPVCERCWLSGDEDMMEEWWFFSSAWVVLKLQDC